MNLQPATERDLLILEKIETVEKLRWLNVKCDKRTEYENRLKTVNDKLATF